MTKDKNLEQKILAFFDGSFTEQESRSFIHEIKSRDELQRKFLSHYQFALLMKSNGHGAGFEKKKSPHLDDESLLAYIDYESSLDADANQKVEFHLQTCTRCVSRMVVLHNSAKEMDNQQFQLTPEFLLHQARALHSSAKTPATLIRKAQNLQLRNAIQRPPSPMEVLDKIGKWLVPPRGRIVWRSVAAFAIALIALAVWLWPSAPVQNISTGNKLTISQIGPFGFVGEHQTIDFKGMHVSLSKNKENLVFAWPEIEGARFYEIYLQTPENERHRITPGEGIEQNEFAYPVVQFETGPQYVWELCGIMTENRVFRAEAAFILNRK